MKKVLVFVTALIVMLAMAQPASAYNGVGSSGWGGVATIQPHMGTITGTFVIPTITDSTCTDAQLDIWIGQGGSGFGGAASYPFVQHGIYIDQTNTAWAWWETDTATGYQEQNLNVHFWRGDTIVLSESWNAKHDTITFAWNDVTTNTVTSKSVTKAGRYYSAKKTTAEWVIEHAGGSGLKQFSPITFTNMTANGLDGINSSSYLIDMLGGSGTIAHPSVINNSSYELDWQGCS